jgi:hypothetical protein
MLKPLIALGSLSAGVSALAGLVYLQTHPHALTGFEERVEQRIQSAPAVQATSAAQAPDPVIVEGPSELVLFKKPHRAVRSVVELKAPVELVPCTEWRDVGPVAATDATQPKQRRVQMLCAAGTEPPKADPEL